MILRNNIIFGTLLCLISVNVIKVAHGNPQTIYLPAHYATIEDAKHEFKNHKPVLLWDLHKVILDHVMKRMFFHKRSNRSSNWWAITKDTAQALLSLNTYRHIYTQARAGNKVTQAYLDAFKNYPNLYEAFLRLANDIHVPNTSVIEILKEMHAHHHQYIFSNIGPAILKDLQQEYPEIFESFSDSKNVINNQDPHTGPWLCKPRPSAYAAALDFIVKKDGSSARSRVIFIDDKLENIKAAQQGGMIGILFTNASQLRNDLSLLGLL